MKSRTRLLRSVANGNQLDCLVYWKLFLLGTLLQSLVRFCVACPFLCRLPVSVDDPMTCRRVFIGAVNDSAPFRYWDHGARNHFLPSFLVDRSVETLTDLFDNTVAPAFQPQTEHFESQVSNGTSRLTLFSDWRTEFYFRQC